ncbi:SDR family NAD(P)-dependent oxidoreductase [Nonomuraea sp. NPDC050790]|uniref:type I polyketide synthase n=1 Tax=Nonomuraea sp. NPDC050790 TaxID=3364371 RepID=UPI003791F52B
MGDLVEPIAIIGMAGRFPGADGTGQLWDNLVAGQEAVRFPSEEELRASGVPQRALDDAAYVRAVAEPAGLDLFDAGFFGLTRREAETCDPQLRLYLETAHAAVENAGHDAARLGRAGVFSSVAANRYAIGRVLGSLESLRSATGMAAGMWNNPDSASTLVSYKLNLHGPSMTVQTACSSSLVAVHLAVNALRLHECDVALAGGADVEFPVGHGYWWAQDGPLSRDGHCRPFDAAATGTIFASGVGVVVLKRLADAVADGDRIRAVIRAVAVNNDGANKVGFTAPSADRQAEVVLRAMEAADVGPEDIGYLEAHATATRLGDAIEIAALKQAFRGRAPSEPPCLIGSIKGNVGHLGHAAGITSLIKAALSLSHEQIPASINVENVNPLLDLDNSPFVVNDKLRPWPQSEGRRRFAGVSSFGIGGTNAHAILEEAPPRVTGPAERTPELIVWSARTAQAAEVYPERLARSFRESAEPLADVAYTLAHGRTPHPVRGAVVAESVADAAAAVLDPLRRVVTPGERTDRSVVFLFPGQEAAHPGMAAELYRTEPVFARALDECAALFETADTTPFSVDYALGRLWLSLGVEPEALLGHGVGQLAAAALAEVFTLPDAVRLARAWGDAERLRSALDGIRPGRPRWTIYTAEGPADVRSADFWTRPSVPFHEALEAVLSGGGRVLLEVGPGRTLTTTARAHPGVRGKRHLAVPTLPSGPSKPATERASFLHALARLWTLGTRVKWSVGPRERVPLPGYPYQRERFWMERPAKDTPSTAASADVPAAEEAVFRLPTWVEAEAPGQPADAPGRALVVLPDDERRADDLLARLRQAGWEAHGASGAEAVPLLAELRESERYPAAIIDATQLGPLAEAGLSTVDDQLDTGFHRLVTLLREAARRAPDKRARDVLVLTEGAADVTGGERTHPARAMLLGLLRSYTLENPRARCKLVDVQDGVNGHRLLAELRDVGRSEIVALRGDRRWVPGERAFVPDAPAFALGGAGSVDLRRGGAYVITGGLGGLGPAVALGLARTGLRPRLLLLGRRVSGNEGALAEIEALGAECRAESCDVTDLAALRRVLDSFGAVNGVFHLAGVVGDGMIQFRTRDQMAATLAPKVHGTLALVEALRDRAGLDFFVAFSSRAALRGLVGGADYAAANAFLDAVVRRQPLPGVASTTVNWPSWSEVGMAARQARRSEEAGRPEGEVRWSAPLSAENYPILDEHRMEGVPVLPGTAQVDFVLRAFREAVGRRDGRCEQISHMVFRQPITTPEPVTLEVGFVAHEGFWRFTVRTAPLPSGGHRVHTTGEIRLAETGADAVDLAALRASLPDRRVPVNDAENRLFTIGPRWPREEIWTSEQDGATKLAGLTFAEAFAHELGEHALHPTLLDAAVSLARDPDREPPHAPFAYQSIVVYRPIPARAFSHIRRRPSGSDTIVADIDVLTPEGAVAVAVRGFTMRRVDESMVAPREQPVAGITPATGFEMLLRVLRGPGHRQVAITLPGEDAVLKNAPSRPDAGDREPSVREPGRTPVREAGRTPSPELDRTSAREPDRTTAGEPGRTSSGDGSLEERLARMWCAAFGVESVGPDEDFFELGGDSFTAVELVEEIRRAFDVDVGIAAVFDHPTVAELAAELRRLTG